MACYRPGRVVDESSEYGTMEPGEVVPCGTEEQRSAVPALNLTTTAGGAFNEISVEERKERIR